MGNTQTHAHTARRHNKHNHSAFTEKKHHHRARHHSRRYFTRKQHGGFWPFSKKENADITVAPSSAADKCASCPAECRSGLPSVSGLTGSLKEGMNSGNQKLLDLNANIKATAGDAVDNLNAKRAGFTGAVSGLFGSAEAPVVDAQAGGRRRRKGRKTNRRRKHKKH